MIVNETILIVPITTHSVYSWGTDIVLKSLYSTHYVNITVHNQVRLVRSVRSVRSVKVVKVVKVIKVVRVVSLDDMWSRWSR